MKNKDTSTSFSYGIMQPYFLPYIGYFSLIKHTDRWIVFDDTQYKKQSWGNRNRILKVDDGLSWIMIPIKKHSRDTDYSDIMINNSEDWKLKMIRQFEYYKVNAPYYSKIKALLEDILTPEFTYLVDLNVFSMSKICEYLEIPFNYVKLSDLHLDVKSKVRHSGDWAFQICTALNIKHYINPGMGFRLFDGDDWKKAEMKLQFLLYDDIEYSQKRNVFESRLSIIDVLMWNSKEEVHKLLDSYTIYSIDELHRIDQLENSKQSTLNS